MTTPEIHAPAWPIRVAIADVYLRLPEGAFDVDVTVGSTKVGRLTLTADQYAELVGEHPEDHCARCGGPNISWAAPSPLWNQVMRGGGGDGDESYDGIVCPTCFAILAEESGVAELWRFSAERVHVPLQTVTPSGRVWDERTWLWREPDGSEGHDAAIEAAYNAITDADPWFGTDQDHWRHAGLAVRAAAPILRQAVAEEIAKTAEQWAAVLIGLRAAPAYQAMADIARIIGKRGAKP